MLGSGLYRLLIISADSTGVEVGEELEGAGDVEDKIETIGRMQIRRNMLIYTTYVGLRS